MKVIGVIVCLGLFFNLMICEAGAKADKMTIQDGKQVSFEYTLTVEGKIVDSSEGKEPLQYVHGQSQIIPGLEKGLVGLQVGEEKVIKVSPQEAYGEVNPKAFHEFPKTSLPENLEPKIDMVLRIQGPEGQFIPAKIMEIKKDSLMLNLNHPLAGKTLSFEVKIVSIK